jgi:pimeloyl-ACP methyl ester carboxylesterase
MVHGGADDIIPLRAAASLRRILKNSEMVVIEGVGHFSMQDSPQRFSQEVNSFLDNPNWAP